MNRKLLTFFLMMSVNIVNGQMQNITADWSGGGVSIATDSDEGNSFFLQAEKNEREGQYDAALDFFGKAAFEFNSSRAFSRYGSALMRLSNVHYLLSHYSEAEKVVLNVALKNYSKIGSRTGQMASYGQLGKIYLASDKLTQSLWFYTQQGILARQMGSSSSNISSIIGIAKVKIKKKEYRMAAEDINKAEKLALAINSTEFRSQIREVRTMIATAKPKS